jgi:hypothetical protein
MDLAKYSTKTIPQHIPVSTEYIIPGLLCHNETVTNSTVFRTFLPVDIQTDTESFSCSRPMADNIGIAEAMATGFVRSKPAFLFSSLLLDWADAKTSGQSSRTIFYDVFYAKFKEEITEMFWRQKIGKLEEHYLFVEKAATRKFLLKNLHCIAPIAEMYTILYGVFSNQMTSLSLIYNNDMEEGFEGLTIMVHTTLSIDEALKRLAIFDETYWLDREFDVRRLLSVTIDPQ